MNAFRRLLVPLVLMTAITGAAGADERPANRAAEIKVGMTARQVRELMGPPARVARQIYSQTILEQWVYERPEAFRLDLLHRLGQEPKVEAIHFRKAR